MSKKIEPNIESNYFTCPHCDQISKIVDVVNQRIRESSNEIINNFSNQTLIKEKIKNHENYTVHEIFSFQKCNNCYRLIIWSEISKKQRDPIIPSLMSKIQSEIKMIYPKFSSSPIPNEDISGDYLIIYNEAAQIFEDSPKAAAALLRTILEKFLRNKFNLENKFLGEILKEKSVNQELGEKITNFLKKLKNIGNNAAHSSRMIYDDDDKEDVKKLFTGINIVFDRLITQEKIIDEFK